MAPVPMCIPVLLSVLAEQLPLPSVPKPLSERVMSVYLPRYNTSCEDASEGRLCYDSVVSNFLRCRQGRWDKVYIDKQIPVLAPVDKRDIAIEKLTSELATLKQQLANSNSQLLHRISSPWCEDGWDLHGYQCYYSTIHTQHLLAWKRANSYCLDQGATLVTIENSQENEYVSRLSGSVTAWIGLKIGEEGAKEWVTQTGGVYDNLAGGGSNSTCVYMDAATGSWYSRDCGVAMTFTCQKSCCGIL